mgnify:FL=1
MNMHTKHELTREILGRYLATDKTGKGHILDEFCANTGYERKYAIAKLHKYQLTPALKWVVPGKHKRKRERMYDMAVAEALAVIWKVYDNICAERLHPNLAEMMDKLVACQELRIDPLTEFKVQSISLGTLKRILTGITVRETNRVGGTTKPGTLLKHEIPLRVGHWEETKPGFLEIDLVAQCGDSASGEFANTLDSTDVYTGWFEAEAVMGKAEERVHQGIRNIRERLPFSLLGLDSDNGGEFINWGMVAYCKKEKITFTRSRPYKKNDNAHIEQKNWTCVRKVLGYTRVETSVQVDLMNELYRGPLRDYINFFLPSVKCLERKRMGAKIVKRYDKAQTPFQRVCESTDVLVDTKERLREMYQKLNPVVLRHQIDTLVDKIFNKKSRARQGGS